MLRLRKFGEVKHYSMLSPIEVAMAKEVTFGLSLLA